MSSLSVQLHIAPEGPTLSLVYYKLWVTCGHSGMYSFRWMLCCENNCTERRQSSLAFLNFQDFGFIGPHIQECGTILAKGSIYFALTSPLLIHLNVINYCFILCLKWDWLHANQTNFSYVQTSYVFYTLWEYFLFHNQKENGTIFFSQVQK